MLAQRVIANIMKYEHTLGNTACEVTASLGRSSTYVNHTAHLGYLKTCNPASKERLKVTTQTILNYSLLKIYGSATQRFQAHQSLDYM